MSECQENCCCRCKNAMRRIVADCLRGMVQVNSSGQVSWKIPKNDTAIDVMPELIEGRAEGADVQSTG